MRVSRLSRLLSGGGLRGSVQKGGGGEGSFRAIKESRVEALGISRGS